MDEVYDYDLLDDLWVGPDEDAPPNIGYAVRATFYFANGHDRAKRQALLDTVADYVGMFPDETVHYLKTGASRVSLRKGDDWRRYYEGQIAALDPAAQLFGVMVKDEDYLNHNFAWGTAKAESQGADALSLFEAGAAPSWVKENLDTYVEAVLRWCEMLKPEQATCGLGPVAEYGMLMMYPNDYWPAIARFPGMDINWPFDLSAKSHAGIRTVNWLTALDDHYVAELGGEGKLRDALHEASTIHPYDGGLLIRACEHPQRGDISYGLWPEPYIRLSHLVRPLRFEDYDPAPVALLRVPDPLDRYEETLDWVRRFDDREG